MLGHELFFFAGFVVSTDKEDDEYEEPIHVGVVYGSAEEHENKAAIDGMADISIWTGSYEFVIFFEDDISAPIPS